MQFRSSAALLAVILEATTAGTHAFATAPAHRLVAMHRRRSPRRGQPASAPFESTSIKGTASDPASKRVRLETGDVAGVVAQHANQVSIPSHLDQSKAFSEGLLGLVASFVISLAVLAIALVSPFVSDGEAMVARCIPTRLAHFLRDRWQSWAVFNRWTWALVAPGLALTRFDLLRQLLEKHGQDLDVPYNDCSHAREIPSAARRTLDIFHHGEPSKSAPRPVVVFVHGGAWSHGSKVRRCRVSTARPSLSQRAASSPHSLINLHGLLCRSWSACWARRCAMLALSPSASVCGEKFQFTTDWEMSQTDSMHM